MAKKKLGIMGGSFDPIHNGHLGTALALEQALQLDEILFIPAYISPFKQERKAAPAQERLAMVELALKGHPTWHASNLELERTGVSYTYNTLATLDAQYGKDYELFFLIGADSILELAKWYKIKEALALSTFVIATRPGFMPQAQAIKAKLAKEGLTNLVWVNTPEFPISSTEIRAKIQKHESLTGLMPPAIVEYIRQRDLYRP